MSSFKPTKIGYSHDRRLARGWLTLSSIFNVDAEMRSPCSRAYDPPVDWPAVDFMAMLWAIPRYDFAVPKVLRKMH